MNHESIYKSHPHVAGIVDTENGVECRDNQGNIVVLNDGLLAIAENEIAKEQEAKEAAKKKSEKKLEGVEFNGVMCSATVTDQLGLLATKAWIEAGGSTGFEFENGNKLMLSPENFAAFAAVWMPFRASFFDNE